MGIMSLITGIIGGLCAVMGIITAVEVIPLALPQQLTGTFWFTLAMILLLASIAFSLGRSAYE